MKDSCGSYYERYSRLSDTLSLSKAVLVAQVYPKLQQEEYHTFATVNGLATVGIYLDVAQFFVEKNIVRTESTLYGGFQIVFESEQSALDLYLELIKRSRYQTSIRKGSIVLSTVADRSPLLISEIFGKAIVTFFPILLSQLVQGVDRSQMQELAAAEKAKFEELLGDDMTALLSILRN